MEFIHSHVLIRFGVFELDTESGELRKQGVKVRLQEQPLQILQVLVERPGRIVTREELQSRIWPSGTFVDFDSGLYNAIKRLREALGDSAERPRFIETLQDFRSVGVELHVLATTSDCVHKLSVCEICTSDRRYSRIFLTVTPVAS